MCMHIYVFIYRLNSITEETQIRKCQNNYDNYVYIYAYKDVHVYIHMYIHIYVHLSIHINTQMSYILIG
jgi:hypothetical protein